MLRKARKKRLSCPCSSGAQRMRSALNLMVPGAAYNGIELRFSRNSKPKCLKQASQPERFLSGQNRVNRVVWGKGPKYGTFKAMLDYQGSAHNLLEVWTDGYLYIQLGDPQAYTLLGEESKRSELLLRLDEVPGISISDQAKKKWASISLPPLSDEAALSQFIAVLDWFVQEVRES